MDLLVCMQVYPACSLPGVVSPAMKLCKSIPQVDQYCTHSEHPFIYVSMKGVCWIWGLGPIAKLCTSILQVDWIGTYSLHYFICVSMKGVCQIWGH